MPSIPYNPDTQPLLAAVGDAWPVAEWRDVNVLVAVSGGADSVALTRAVAALKAEAGGRGRVLLGHFNHRLRGAASDGDQRFVEQLADRLRFEPVVARADSPPSCEESARDARYAFLTAEAQRHAARFVAMGHHRDDQIETILHRVLRGSGLAGLGGIPPLRPLASDTTLVRPLLAVSRADIEAYLQAINQGFCRDATNDASSFTRNWLRNELLPLIRARLGDAAPLSLLALSEQASEVARWMAIPTWKLYERAVVVEPVGEAIRIDGTVCRGEPPVLVREAIREAWRRAGWPEQAMTYRHWVCLGEMVVADETAAPITLPSEVRAERRGDWLVLAPPAHRVS